MRLHVNANFYVDNSKNVYDLSTATAESRQTAKFAYGIGASRVRLAAGIDAPLEKYTGPVPLRPFAEYHAEIVTAAADPALVDVSAARRAARSAVADVRLAHAGVSGRDPRRRRRRAVALDRARVPAAAAALRGALRRVVSAGRRRLQQAGDRHPGVEKKVEAPPTEGRIAGVAKDKAGKGIGHAIVAVAGRPHASVVTDADGTFEIAALAPGPANVEVEAPDFEGEKVMAMVTAGQVTEVSLALTPKARTGSVRGKTTDAQGHAVEATLKFSGAQALETRTDGSGLYQAALLPGALQGRRRGAGAADEGEPVRGGRRRQPPDRSDAAPGEPRPDPDRRRDRAARADQVQDRGGRPS